MLIINLAKLPHVHDALENFDKNVHFSLDALGNNTFHIDIEISAEGLTMFTKNTFTSQ